MIKIEHMSKSYGPYPAVIDISFEVLKGEIVGFLGPNGAGKTTTMRVVTGFTPPTEGDVTVGGYDVVSHSLDVRRHIGYLPETVPLYLDMTVTDYLTYMGEIRGMNSSWVKERLPKVIEMVRLGEYRNTLVGRLSKGYRQRVGIAQALLHEPEIIILDEPTVGLDPNQVVDVRTLISEIGEARTVVLCSHILSEVEATCGRVVIINEGRIVANDTPEALKQASSDRTWFDVRAKGPSTTVAEAVGNVSGVAGLQSTGEALGISSVRFESPASDAEIGPAVAAALSGAGLELVSLTPRRASLEDVFRGLTRTEDA